MIEQFRKLIKDEEAPTAVEYALMVAGIGMTVIAMVLALGGQVGTTFTGVTTKLAGLPH
jgi:pilus assembly protein Flp/PilA